MEIDEEAFSKAKKVLDMRRSLKSAFPHLDNMWAMDEDRTLIYVYETNKIKSNKHTVCSMCGKQSTVVQYGDKMLCPNCDNHTNWTQNNEESVPTMKYTYPSEAAGMSVYGTNGELVASYDGNGKKIPPQNSSVMQTTISDGSDGFQAGQKLISINGGPFRLKE